MTMRIAAAQVHGAWLDPVRTTEIVTDWIGRAPDEDIELVAFGETFLGGYPLWLSVTDGARFDDAGQKAAYAAYLDAAVEVDGPEVSTIIEGPVIDTCSPTSGRPNVGRAPAAAPSTARCWRSIRNAACSARTAS